MGNQRELFSDGEFEGEEAPIGPDGSDAGIDAADRMYRSRLGGAFRPEAGNELPIVSVSRGKYRKDVDEVRSYETIEDFVGALVCFTGRDERVIVRGGPNGEVKYILSCEFPDWSGKEGKRIFPEFNGACVLDQEHREDTAETLSNHIESALVEIGRCVEEKDLHYRVFKRDDVLAVGGPAYTRSLFEDIEV